MELAGLEVVLVTDLLAELGVLNDSNAMSATITAVTTPRAASAGICLAAGIRRRTAAVAINRGVESVCQFRYLNATWASR